MRTQLCDTLDIEFPIIAFSHCRDVVAAVTNAGGFGVFGATAYTPDELEVELRWLDEHTGGRGYGLDVLIPRKSADPVGNDGVAGLPEQHRAFLDDMLRRYGVPPLEGGGGRAPRTETPARHATELWEVGASHPVKLFASALGPPPGELIEKAHSQGAIVAALVGKVEHVRHQQAAGVDLLVAQGYEAGGHTGEIATMVLVPEIVDAVAPLPVVAAGGIACGRQVAAALALGAVGVWTGSVWLTTQEAETHPVVKQKFLRASSSDTLRSRSSTGKPARQLRSAWTDEWESPDNPDPLPMPLHGALISEAKARINHAAHQSGSGAEALANYFVGQVVGRLTSIRPAREVLLEMAEECADVLSRFEQLGTR